MDLGLKGRVAIVAAASKGLGRAIATELATEGCEVAICARTAADRNAPRKKSVRPPAAKSSGVPSM